jgi:SPP1 gp7 family putative phage head morphogenesis protein
MKTIEVSPIPVTPSDYDEIEGVISEVFKDEVYLPLWRELTTEKSASLHNTLNVLVNAINRGQIRFYRGRFTGKFNSQISRELRKLGARYNRRTKSYNIQMKELPRTIRDQILISEDRLLRELQKIDKRIAEISPEKIAKKLKLEKIIDKKLWTVSKRIDATLRRITVSPKLTKKQVEQISKEYTNNMRLYIKKWTEQEIKRLRKRVKREYFSGNRYEGMVEVIRKSYGVSQSKARFLARQETHLLMSQFKQSRYKEAGVNEYKWKTVAGSPDHPVRPMHKKLDNKIFSWDDPPVVNERGDRKHPGEDYGCRCFAIPVVRF